MFLPNLVVQRTAQSRGVRRALVLVVTTGSSAAGSDRRRSASPDGDRRWMDLSGKSLTETVQCLRDWKAESSMRSGGHEMGVGPTESHVAPGQARTAAYRVGHTLKLNPIRDAHTGHYYLSEDEVERLAKRLVPADREDAEPFCSSRRSQFTWLERPACSAGRSRIRVSSAAPTDR
jgi:hypothetical protein